MATFTRPQPGDADYEQLARAGRRLLAEEGTVAIFQDAITQLGGSLAMTPPAWRVLWTLIGTMEPGNYVYWSAAECARQMQISYGVCRRAWLVLKAHDLIRPDLNDLGQMWRYRLSPHLCWRGRPWKARIAQKNWDAEAQLARLAQTWDTPRQDA